MNALQRAIETFLENVDIQKLKKASTLITSCYREGGTLSSEEALLAYIIVRMPATYAAICAVLKNLPQQGTFLDLGAGPGTLFWAAQEATSITAIERESTFIDLGKKLSSKVVWQHKDLLSCKEFQPHDWVFLGYSLGEIPEHARQTLLTIAWQAARLGLIIIEPGTPRGNQNMLQARAHLISQGGFVIAPCPHSRPCPMTPPDWCHFSVRLDRSFLHRTLKTATLPYEDEKFSYTIITKTDPGLLPSRLIHSPMHRSGHTLLPLCTPTGLQTITLSRRHKELYKKARKLSWGDAIEFYR